MAKKILGENIDPKCAYCAFGTLTADEKTVLCPKKGILDPDFSCKKFSYDPLKRTPRRPKKLQTFSAQDFEL